MNELNNSDDDMNQGKSYEEISALVFEEEHPGEELQDCLARLVKLEKITQDDFYDYLKYFLELRKSHLFELLAYNKALHSGAELPALYPEAHFLKLSHTDPKDLKSATLVQIFQTHAHGKLAPDMFDRLMKFEQMLKKFIAKDNNFNLLKNVYTDEMPEGFVTHYSTVEGFSDYIAAKTEAAFSESFKKIDDYSDKDGTRTQVFQKRGGPKEAESLIPNQPEVLIHN